MIFGSWGVSFVSFAKGRDGVAGVQYTGRDIVYMCCLSFHRCFSDLTWQLSHCILRATRLPIVVIVGGLNGRGSYSESVHHIRKRL